jgi:glycosyltransferase involved in cell wall biosynthesis
LNLLGCGLPDELVGANDGNELGHWESAAAVTLNDEILASAGTSWEDWGPLNEDWRESPLRNEMIGRAVSVVQDHVRLGSLFVLKDPRLCRVADLWLDAMSEADIDPLAILMLRNPAEVIASLESRDLMVPGYGQLLWLRHVLDAEYFSRGRKRVVCRYDQLMSNWFAMIERVKTGLGVALPRNSPKVHAEIEQFLSHQHRHHAMGPEAVMANPALSVWLRRTFAIMLAWSEQEEDPANYAELDEIRLEFNRSYSTFARLLLPGSLSGELFSGSRLRQELTNQLAETQRSTNEMAFTKAQAEAELALAVAREAELAGEIDAGYRRFQQLQNEVEDLRAKGSQLDEIAAEANALRAREAELSAMIDTEKAHSESLQAEKEALHAETERLGEVAAEARELRAREAELTARIEAGEGRFLELQTEVGSLRAEAEKLRTEAERLGTANAEADALRLRQAELEANLAELHSGNQRAQSQFELEQQKRLDAEERLAGAMERLQEHQLQNAELAGRLATAESTLIQRQEELTQLWRQLLSAETASTLAKANEAHELERRLAAEQRIEAVGNNVADLQLRLEQAKETSRAQTDRQVAEIIKLTKMLQDESVATEIARATVADERERRIAAEQQIAAVTNDRANLQSRLAQAEAVSQLNADRLSSEITQLSGMLRDQERAANAAITDNDAMRQTLAERTREAAQLSANLQQKEALARASEAARVALEQKLAQRADEISRLTSVLADENVRASHPDGKAKWLRDSIQVAAGFPRWWALMPEDWRRKREHARYLRSGLFDAAKYLETYPDVAANGMDPVRHYILHGMAENRFPGIIAPTEVRPTLPVTAISYEPQKIVVPQYPEIPLTSGQKRILMIDGTYPTPDRDSGSVDTVNFVKIFNELGYSVYFVATANFKRKELDAISGDAREKLSSAGVVILDDEYQSDIRELIRLKGGYFEIFFLSRVYAGGEFFEDVRTHAPESRIIFNTVDLHGLREMREGQLLGDRAKVIESYRTTEREQYLTRVADVTIVVSAEEAKMLEERVPGAQISVVPLIRDIPGTSVPLAARSDIGFLGGYKHTPNVDAVTYFLDEIWPLIHAQLPAMKFKLMGADMPAELKARTDPGLVVVGHVDNLQTAFDSLRLTVAPLRFGAGAKGKVVSSLSHGVPCVVTSIASEGMGLQGVLVADRPDAFASEVVRLYTDDELWRSLSESGLNLMNRNYSLAAGTELIRQLFNQVR